MDHEEATAPRMDEASPLRGTKLSRRRLLVVPAVIAVAALGVVTQKTTTRLYGQATAAPCTDVEKLEISKYTITSSSPPADAAFAQRVFGSVDQAYGGSGVDDGRGSSRLRRRYD